MKQQNSKTTFTLKLFMISCVFLFINCSKDSYESIDGHTGIDKNKINLTQFKNETNMKRLDPILQINSKLAINSKIKNQLSAFYIDTLIIKKLVTAQQKATYTFRIYPLEIQKDPLIVYNLVYRSVNSKWEYSIFLIHKKKVVGPDFKLFDKIDLIYDSATATARSAKSAGIEICAYSTPIVECNGSCKGPCDGWNCSTGECIRYIVTYTVCSSSSPTSGGGSSDPGSQVYSGNSPTDPYSSDPVLFDKPVYDDPNYINAVKRSYVWTNLGEAAQLFFASTPENTTYFNQTIQYQINQNWLQVSADFAQEMRIRKFDNPTVFNSITPFLIEKQINDTQLNPCLKGIMEQLKMATNSDIANVMAKMDAINVYNLTMKMGTVPPGKYAATTKVSKNNYLVTVTQNDFTTSSKLYRATALLHETIHAYMLSVVDDYNTYPTNAPFTDFPELFKIYVSKINKVNNAEIAQHEDMSNKYIDAIASALEEYQTSTTGIPSSLADKQVFLDMAWSGLQGTAVYNKKSQEGIIDDTRITARIGAELTGSYSQGQYPVGSPCN